MEQVGALAPTWAMASVSFRQLQVTVHPMPGLPKPTLRAALYRGGVTASRPRPGRAETGAVAQFWRSVSIGDGGRHLAGGVSFLSAVAKIPKRSGDCTQIGVFVVPGARTRLSEWAPPLAAWWCSGVVGRVGLDALAGQRLEARGRAGS